MDRSRDPGEMASECHRVLSMIACSGKPVFDADGVCDPDCVCDAVSELDCVAVLVIEPESEYVWVCDAL